MRRGVENAASLVARPAARWWMRTHVRGRWLLLLLAFAVLLACSILVSPARAGEAPGPRGQLVASAAVAPTDAGSLGAQMHDLFLSTPWWVLLPLIALAALRSERAAISIVALLLPVNAVAFFVAPVGLLAAAAIRAGRRGAHAEYNDPALAAAARAEFARRPWRSALALPFQTWRRGEAGSPARLLASLGPAAAVLILIHAVRIAVLTCAAAAVAGCILGSPALDARLAAVVAFTAAYITTGLLGSLFTWTGRQRLRATVARTLHHEHWPSFVFYAPLAPYLLWLAAKHRHPLAFTAINRGIENGGGVVGESKAAIMARLAPITPAAAATFLIPAGGSPAERAARAVALTREDASFSLPVIVKPDAGQRGFAVRLIRDEAGFEPYFAEMTRDAIVQQYAAGPEEIGLMWIRRPQGRHGSTRYSVAQGCHGSTRYSAAQPCDRAETAGFIFSITRKVFPILEADGAYTIEQQLYAHPRYRRQADRFLERLGPRRYEIPQAGERIKLAEAGNHCQGTMFVDGADLITPELTHAIDDIARAFPVSHDEREGASHGGGGGLDLGRFDLRFASYEDLKAGRHFTIVELNGATSESTNIYDPRGSLVWAYGYLFRQWGLMYALGAERRLEGARPLGISEILTTLASFYRARTGSDLSD